MHKKDYVKFTALLKKTNPLNKELFKGVPRYGYEESLNQHSRIIAGIAGIFKEDNPNFDYNRFIKAPTNETKTR